MKKILLYFCIFCLYLSAEAQDTPNAFADRINHIFQYVDKGQVSTGILQEYGIEFTNLNNLYRIQANTYKWYGDNTGHRKICNITAV